MTSGVGVGKIAKDSSWTRPPVIDPILWLDSQPSRFHIIDNILSAPMYNAHVFAAQYAWTRPLLKGKSREITCYEANFNFY